MLLQKLSHDKLKISVNGNILDCWTIYTD